MRLIQCPNRPTYVFLAGGISNCPNWQSNAIQQLSDMDDGLVVINPRRDDFDIKDPSATVFQIKWEFDHLHQSDAVLFWFPCETLCPITLYELGVHAARGVPLFVGVHPDYQRKVDVVEQMKHLRPDVKVHYHLDHVINDVCRWYLDRTIPYEKE